MGSVKHNCKSQHVLSPCRIFTNSKQEFWQFECILIFLWVCWTYTQSYLLFVYYLGELDLGIKHLTSLHVKNLLKNHLHPRMERTQSMNAWIKFHLTEGDKASCHWFKSLWWCSTSLSCCFLETCSNKIFPDSSHGALLSSGWPFEVGLMDHFSRLVPFQCQL